MRKPLRLTGGLLINPRRAKKRTSSSSAAKFKALNLNTLTNPRHKRRNPKKAKSLRVRRFGTLTVNPRHKRNPRKIRRNRLFGALTVNPRRRRRLHSRARHNPRRKARSKARVLRVRSNPRRHKRKNAHGHKMRYNPAGLHKIPVVGPLLAALASFLPHAAFGAVSVEPTMAVASMIGRFAPGLSASMTYAAAGVVAAAGISMLPFGSRELRTKLAIAAASAGGGIAYYKWRSGQDSDAGSEMHGLAIAGYSGPMGLLTATPQAFGGYAGSGAYADAGPMWVGPMG